MSRFVRPVLWTFGALAVGGFAFWLLLALNIPYRSTAAPETTSQTVPAPPPVSAPPAEFTATVTDVRAGPDDHSAVLHVGLSACAVGSRTQVTETADRIDAAVLYRTTDNSGCQWTSADFPMKTSAPIGTRRVVVNDQDTWGLVSGGWKKCDKFLGCQPPADHCDRAWIAQLEFRVEAEFPGTTRACDQNWLIHDLRHRGRPVSRAIYRWTGSDWASFAWAQGGGCAEILAVEPKFPIDLCRRLAPPS